MKEKCKNIANARIYQRKLALTVALSGQWTAIFIMLLIKKDILHPTCFNWESVLPKNSAQNTSIEPLCYLKDFHAPLKLFSAIVAINCFFIYCANCLVGGKLFCIRDANGT